MSQEVKVKWYLVLFPLFCYKDNSVHLYECSPFWVGIFITCNKEDYHVYLLFYVDMHILIDKALKYFYML